MSSPDNASPSPVRSMTGYAQLRQPVSAGDLLVSLRSVNHRGLDLHFHLGGEFARFETGMRALLKEHISRGHLEVRVALTREAAASVGALYNRETLKRYVEAFRQACRELSLDSKPDLNLLLTLPGVLGGSPETVPLAEEFEAELKAALSVCIASLNECREREGRELAVCLNHELAELEDATRQIVALRAEALVFFQSNLREKLRELLSGVAVPEDRLAEEVALLADRSDVQEELTRLAVHTQELRRILEKGGQVGKPLDFLLQEMNREANTTLSKSSGVGEPGLQITRLALGIKANIERIREQALNLE
jgi:uncharacterized protein (TIGR00255 family)